MRITARMFVAATLLIIWVLAPPLAAASGACIAMSGVCEGPCGAASCTTVIRVASGVLPAVADVIGRALDSFPSAPLRLPDLPPRSPLLLA
jgi:hypothetical protein